MTIYLLDLGGNVRKGHAGDSNVFDIQSRSEHQPVCEKGSRSIKTCRSFLQR